MQEIWNFAILYRNLLEEDQKYEVILLMLRFLWFSIQVAANKQINFSKLFKLMGFGPEKQSYHLSQLWSFFNELNIHLISLIFVTQSKQLNCTYFLIVYEV